MSKVKATLERYKKKIVTQLKDRLTQEKLVASNNLKNSIFGRVTQNKDRAAIEIYAADYAVWVEQGREKGKMPVDRNNTEQPLHKIIDWVKNKNVKSINKKYKRPKDIAWMIAKSIADRGTIKRYGYQGSKFIDYVSNSITASLTRDLESSYLEDINDQINGNKKT
jgi:hypothetical protein